MKPSWALVLCAAAVAGCAGIAPQAKDLLSEPPQCRTAAADLAVLEDSKRGWLQRLAHGIQGVAPPAVIISLFRDISGNPHGLYMDHWRTAFGTYNERIDSKVGEIRAACEG